jgi:hypothetical protein
MATKFWRYKQPIEYELNPTAIDEGNNWVTLKLKNMGNETLENLDVQLHSLDTYNLLVHGTSEGFGAGQYLSELKPNEEKEIAFQINASGSADLYITIKGRKYGKYFWWESSRTYIKLITEKAEISSLLVLSNPYTTIGKTISAEANIKGLKKSTGLKLEFWVENPSRKSEKQATTEIKELSAGEEARYTAEFTPKETGDYTIYAYLYDGWKRIGYKTETIYARKQ